MENFVTRSVWIALLLAVAGFAPPLAAAGPLRDAGGACVLLPPDSPLRRDVSGLPVHPDSDAMIAAITHPDAPGDVMLHPDFSGGEDRPGGHIYYGIPISYADTSKGDAFSKIMFDYYADESNPGPYPFRPDAKIEGSFPGCSAKACTGDRHVLTVDEGTCTLYEAWYCREPKVDSPAASGWLCANGAVFNLSSPEMPQRPLGWTSGDAAGLPIAPLLVRAAEVRAGEIAHAIRFTSPNSASAYIRPASHMAPTNELTHSPPMGTAARLKAAFDCNARLDTRAARIVCAAMRKYGLVLADNGSPFYIGGEATPEWESDPTVIADFDAFHTDMRRIRASDFEIVNTGACLCTTSKCTACPGTDPPPPPPPTPGGGASGVLLRRGQPSQRLDGSTTASYDQVVEAGISDAGGAPNGATAFWPYHSRLRLQEAPAGAGLSSRALLLFGGLDAYVPTTRKSARVTGAVLNLTVANAGGAPLAAQALVLRQAWVGTNTSGAGPERSLGWAFRQPNPSKPATGRAQKWPAPGGWSKAPRAGDVIRFTIPPAGGASEVTVQLPSALVKAWAASKGRSNFGLLLRLEPGSVGSADIVSSGSPDEAARPALRVEF